MPEDQAPNPRAVAGGNSPPPYREETVKEHDAKASEFLDAAGEWLALQEITSEEQASQLNDFISGLKKRRTQTDNDRKADKKPHDDAGKTVQAAYSPILEKLKRAIDRVTPMQTAWLTKQDEIRREEARKAEEAARKAAEEAEQKAAQAASRNDISGEVEAEEAAKAAAAAQKDAERAAKSRANVKSATGGGRTTSLRTYVTAEVTNPRAAFMHYAENPDLLACMKTLAEREARAAGFDAEKDTIPGVKLTVTRKAV